MNMKRSLLLLALAVIIPASAFAWGGKLSTLTVFFPNGTPTETMKNVSNYLTNRLLIWQSFFSVPSFLAWKSDSFWPRRSI